MSQPLFIDDSDFTGGRGIKSRAKPRQDEDKLQVAVANYIRSQYPKILWCHIPNGGKRNKIVGAKLKRMGVLAGMPDIMIYENRGGASGLAIELKTPKGKVQDSQKERHEDLRRCNWRVEIHRSFDEAKEAIDNYLNERL